MHKIKRKNANDIDNVTKYMEGGEIRKNETEYMPASTETSSFLQRISRLNFYNKTEMSAEFTQRSVTLRHSNTLFLFNVVG